MRQIELSSLGDPDCFRVQHSAEHLMSTPFLVATTTWNSVDLIGIFLSHYRKLGFQRAFVMDFDSTDGTRDILLDPYWAGFVGLVPFPGLARLDSSNILLADAREATATDAWCLFCDPDELLVTPAMDLARAGGIVERAGADWILVPRFNVTAPRAIALYQESRLTALDALTLRVQRGQSRLPDIDAHAETLVPPWVFSRIEGKVLLRLSSDLTIGEGDHTVVPWSDSPPVAPTNSYLLHYPFRSFPMFREKVDLARRGFQANPHLPNRHGWQVRRWIALADRGHLRREFLDQFVADHEVDLLLSDGTLEVERSIVDFHRGLSAPATPAGVRGSRS